MNILQRANKRRSRQRTATLEYLDARIVPAVVHPTVAVAADVAGMHSNQPPENVVPGESASQIKHEQRLARLAERREAKLERREAALERRELRDAAVAARYAARHHITLAGAVQDQVISPASTNSTSATTIPSTRGSASSTSGSTSSTSGSSSTGSSAGSSSGSNTTGSTSPTSPVTTPGSTTSSNPLPANVSTLLDTVYEEFENGTLPASTGKPGGVEIQGSDVGIQIQTSNSSDFNTLVADAESLGLQVTDSSAAYNIVVGFLPISALPSAAQLAGSPSITPLLYPIMN
jgi:hypothetical protein